MKNFFLISVLLICSNALMAQYGINVGLRTNGETNWQHLTGQDDFLKTGYKVGIDYWFRL